MIALLLIVAGPMAAPATAQAEGIAGFRSARFGMTEEEVLAAIEADFGIAAWAIDRAVQPVEKTTSLVFRIDGLVADTGVVEIAYMLGYISKRLMQVNMLWRQPPGALDGSARLARAAAVMMRRFALQRFPRDESVENAVLEDGSILVFRAEDNRGRIAVIRLKERKGGGDASRARTSHVEGSWLRVSLIERVAAPDVFRIEPGQF